nr:glycoprotein vIgFam8 [Elephant endotheliotropic herpesvirus 1A]
MYVGGGLSSQFGYYILLMFVYTLQGDTLNVITANIDKTAIFGPSGVTLNPQSEVIWFYNQSKLIMYYNSTNVKYYNTSARHDSRPYRVNIPRVKSEDSGNYTIQIKGNGKTETHYFMLIINSTIVHNTPAPLQDTSSYTSLQLCNYYIHFVIIVTQYSLT